MGDPCPIVMGVPCIRALRMAAVAAMQAKWRMSVASGRNMPMVFVGERLDAHRGAPVCHETDLAKMASQHDLFALVPGHPSFLSVLTGTRARWAPAMFIEPAFADGS